MWDADHGPTESGAATVDPGENCWQIVDVDCTLALQIADPADRQLRPLAEQRVGYATQSLFASGICHTISVIGY